MVVDTSRPVATVAREQGVNEQSLRNWVNEYRAAHAEGEPPLTVSERARLRELEKENRKLFFAALKNEHVHRTVYPTCQHA